ncbi:hypothetical protein PA598K_06786, partial [Paenibacillus sp. 598K]|uniref:glycoside hydrolase family 55 protein n=1 Tax=Paenibacillus sp. 598K TaxID=1117987 RepID=UPI000FF92CE0
MNRKKWKLTIAVLAVSVLLLTACQQKPGFMMSSNIKDNPHLDNEQRSVVNAAGTTVGVVNGVYNVEECGADGSDTIDDRAAIQTCINQAQSNGGGTVYFPSGTYYVNGSLSITVGKMVLAGMNNADTTIVGTNGAANLLVVQDSTGNVVNHTTIRDLGFQYSEDNASGILMEFNNVWRTYLKDIMFGNSGAYYRMGGGVKVIGLSLIHISEPTRR